MNAEIPGHLVVLDHESPHPVIGHLPQCGMGTIAQDIARDLGIDLAGVDINEGRLLSDADQARINAWQDHRGDRLPGLPRRC